MKIDKNALLWIVIAILAVLVVYVVFFQGSTTSAQLSPTAGQAAQAYSGMVGGC
jgi:flagellar basal body-associated protein FliL